MDEPREFLIWIISYGQIGFLKFFKCKIFNYAFLILGFFTTKNKWTWGSSET